MNTLRTEPVLLQQKHDVLSQLYAGLIIAVVVFIACLSGILTRSVNFLAEFWPANAILIGLLLRKPHLTSIYVFTGAIAGYMLADILTGSSIIVATALTVSNLAAVISCIALFRLLPSSHRRLEKPQSVLYLFGICIISAVASSSMMTFLEWLTITSLFHQQLFSGFINWFTAEMVNCILIIPVMLVATLSPVWIGQSKAISLKYLAPLLATLLSLVAGVLIGGPGAIAFSVPALLWCALVLPLCYTAIVTLIVNVWLIIAASSGIMVLSPYLQYSDFTLSIRIGIILIALGPLTVATVNNGRNLLLKQLRYSVNHDHLTGVLSRAAFFNQGGYLLEKARQQTLPVAVMMLDIDKFKLVNDKHGHAVGDEVLKVFTEAVTDALPEGSMIGRLGGEEFAIFVANHTPKQAFLLAEAIRENVSSRPVILADKTLLNITVSIGLVWQELIDQPISIDTLMLQADESLYDAKSSGRNKVVRYRKQEYVTES